MAHFKFSALEELNAGKRIQITHCPRDLVTKEETSLSSLTHSELTAANRRHAYINGMLKLAPHNPCSQAAIKAHLSTLAAELSDQDPPAPSTIASWIHRWKTSGQNVVALANKTKPSRRDFNHLDPKVLEFINSAIRDVYLQKNRGRKCDVSAEVLRLVANYNAGSAIPLAMPSDYIVNRVINQIDLYERDVMRKGKAFANRHHRAAGKSFLAAHPLELCMADGQLMDVILVEESADGGPRKVLGRPFLTAVLDIRTRCILAAYISLQPFCGGTVLKAMTEAVVAAPGRPRGVMATLVVDNGCDYKDSGFLRFLSDLDIQLEICGPRAPNGKANIERFFRTLNEDLIHKLPGTTFSNPGERGEYRSQDMARLTLADLRGRVQTWIDEIYHQRPHRSLGRAPIDVWNDEVHS